MEKRLMRSQQNKIIAGVCGGIGEYFDIDPVLVRIITVVLAFATGFGLLAYIVAWIIMPKREPQFYASSSPTSGGASSTPSGASNLNNFEKQAPDSSWTKYLPGFVLMAIGVVLLVRENWFWFDWDEFWPVLLIVVGLALIFRRGRNHEKDGVYQSSSVDNGAKMENGGGSL